MRQSVPTDGTATAATEGAASTFHPTPLLAAPPAPLSFLGRVHATVVPYLTRSNVQRTVLTLIVLVLSYAILTTPEARRKVLRSLDIPRRIVRRIWRRSRMLYGRVSGNSSAAYNEEDGFFIEEPPKKRKKSKQKQQGRRSKFWSIGGDAGSEFVEGILTRWGFGRERLTDGRRRASGDAAAAGQDDQIRANNGDGSSSPRVHLIRASPAVGMDGMRRIGTDRPQQRLREHYAATMPFPIHERGGDERSESPSGSNTASEADSAMNHRSMHHQQQHPVLRHAYSMAPKSSTMASASSLCTGLFTPENDISSQERDLEEETDHDRFSRAWPKIRSSPYGRLVLPPECRMLEIKGRRDGDDAVDGEDSFAMPWRSWFLHLVLACAHKSKEKIIAAATFDYVAVGLGFYLKLMKYFQYRLDKMRGKNGLDDDDDDNDANDDDEEEEEEEDERSLNSGQSSETLRRVDRLSKDLVEQTSGVRVSPVNRERFYTVDPRSHPNEEKKDTSPDDTAHLLPELQETESSGPDVDDSPKYPALTPVGGNNSDELWVTPGNNAEQGLAQNSGSLPLIQGDISNVTSRSRTKPKSNFFLATPDENSCGRAGNELQSTRGVPSDNENELKKTSDSVKRLSPRPLLNSKSTPTLFNAVLPPSSRVQDPLIGPSASSSNSVHSSELQDLAFFDAAVSNASLKRLAKDVPLAVPDKNGYIVGDDLLPDSRWTPLLVFVNSRSGSRQGQLILMQLRRLLNPIQIWDLADGDPTTVLESFLALSRLRILVCGGDGTVSWIISTLEKMQLERRWPPIAILPLGTGNDLARIHGWGAGYNNESILMILEQITDAYVSLLDRWELAIETRKGKIKETKSFMNYLGVGVDAQTALGFHTLRENRPQLFFSRAVNKAWYVVSGAEDAIKASCSGLPEEISLIADGVEVPLPADSQGIILLNIDSYAGGVPLWSHGEPMRRQKRGRRHSEGDLLARRRASLGDDDGDKSDDVDTYEFTRELNYEERLAKVTACDMPSSCQDGLLDVVSINSIFHMGQIKVGLSRAQLVCQCREVEIRLKKKKVPVQIDGEPWKQNPCTLRVRRKKEPALMLHRAAAEGGGVETEMAKLLDWAEERELIDRNVHATLMREFSRRIEGKARQRRFSTNDNTFFSMKR